VRGSGRRACSVRSRRFPNAFVEDPGEIREVLGALALSGAPLDRPPPAPQSLDTADVYA